MSRTRSSRAQSAERQEGFTLAALIVVMTILAIIVAYTVPTQWSLVMRRERERQTIFLMKQYARGIENWERKHQSLPVSLEQLQEARDPRMLRGDGKWAMPLTGKDDDWIMVPPNAIEAVGGAGAIPPPSGTGGPAGIGGQRGVGIGGGQQRPPAVQQPGQPGQLAPPSKLNPEASPKDYVGPFVAVRPNAKGESLLEFNGATDYSQWVYTVQDLKNERAMRQMAMSVK